MKEFSKARLRKRAQSEMLRASGPGRGRRPAKLAAPELDSDAQGPDNLSLIREFEGRWRFQRVLMALRRERGRNHEEGAFLVRGSGFSLESNPVAQVDHPNMCSIHEVVDVTSSDSLLVGKLVRDVWRERRS